jgi:DNA-directed RNA polymerase subunit beta'
MRTFHTAVWPGEDITHGLPRVTELFEARTPKGVALIAEAAGRTAHRDTEGAQYRASRPTTDTRRRLPRCCACDLSCVEDGQQVELGQQLAGGRWTRRRSVRAPGDRAVQLRTSSTRSRTSTAGQGVRDRRQAHRGDRAGTLERRRDHRERPGRSPVLEGELVERLVVLRGGEPRAWSARGPVRRPPVRPLLLMGSTKASLATESSWHLGGLLPGDHAGADRGGHPGRRATPACAASRRTSSSAKLIPAGTGLPGYRNVAGGARRGGRADAVAVVLRGPGTAPASALGPARRPGVPRSSAAAASR